MNIRDLVSIRTVIQVLAFGIFVFQMVNSLRKYIEKPIFQKENIQSYADSKKPVIYICQEDQFRYDEAQSNGYVRKTFFTMGKLMDTENISWNGKNLNQTYDDLRKAVYMFDYASLEIKGSDFRGISGLNHSHSEEVFIPMHGFCHKLSETKMQVQFHSTVNLNIFIVDPQTTSNIKITEIDNTKISFGPTTENLFKGANYELKITLINSNINDGKRCTNYEKHGSSYGNCLEQVLETHLLEWYGCTPPWFPQNESSAVCNSDNTRPLGAVLTQVADEFVPFLDGQDMTIFKACLPPCEKMKVEMRETAHISNRLNYAKINFIAKEEVLVLTDLYAYDIFSLIVDLGSALGLWLGLSALSIFDYISQGIVVAKSKYFPFRGN